MSSPCVKVCCESSQNHDFHTAKNKEPALVATLKDRGKKSLVETMNSAIFVRYLISAYYDSTVITAEDILLGFNHSARSV